MMSDTSSHTLVLFSSRELRLVSSTPEGVRELSVPLAGLAWGEVQDIDQLSDALTRAVAAWQFEYGQTLKHLDYACIASVDIRSMRTHGVTEIRQGRVAPYEVDEVYQSALKLGLPEGMVCYDAWPLWYEVDQHMRVLDPVGLEGRRLEGQFHVLALPDKALSVYKVAAKKAGVSLGSLLMYPLLLDVLPSPHRQHAGQRLLVDVGEEYMSVALIERNICRYAAVYPMGEALFCRDLMTCLGVDCDVAARLYAECPQWDQKQRVRRQVYGVDSQMVAEVVHARAVEMGERLYDGVCDQLRWDLPLVVEVRGQGIEYYWRACLEHYFKHALIEFYPHQTTLESLRAAEAYVAARASRALYVPVGWRYWWGRCKNWIEYHL